MKKIICMSLVLIVILTNTVFASQLSFSDVENHWAKKEIYKMAEKWVILGNGDGTFSPDNDIIKTHAFLMFSRLMGFYNKENKEIIKQGVEEYGILLKEENITEGIEEISFLLKQEIISIEDVIKILGSEKQDEKLTRLEASYLFIKLLGDEEKINRFPLITYTDVDDIPEEYQGYVEYANKIGLMIGYDNKFNPNGYITRAQIATILSRIDDIIEKRGIKEKQGLITNIDLKRDEITIINEEKEDVLQIENKTQIFDKDKRILLSDLKENDFVNVYIDDNIVNKIVVNNVERVVYSKYKKIIIENNKQFLIIENENGVEKYEILQNELEIKKDNNTINFKDITEGENIKIVLKNDKVQKVVVGEIKYNISGSIKEITIGEKSYLTIQDLKGNINKYLISENAIFDFDGAIGNIYDLRLNNDVVLTIGNKGIEKIKVETLTNIEIITGTVDKLLPKIYVFTIKLDNGQLLMMFLDEQETVIKTSNGIAKSIEDINQGDVVSIYGRYEQDVFYPIQVIIIKGGE